MGNGMRESVEEEGGNKEMLRKKAIYDVTSLTSLQFLPLRTAATMDGNCLNETRQWKIEKSRQRGENTQNQDKGARERLRIFYDISSFVFCSPASSPF